MPHAVSATIVATNHGAAIAAPTEGRNANMIKRLMSGSILAVALIAAAATVSTAGEGPTLAYGLEGQLRALLSHLDEPGDEPGTDGGMQVRTARLDVRAKSEDGRMSGRFMVGADRASGGIEIEYAYADLALPRHWRLRVGQFKPEFLREESIGSTDQLAAERSYTADYFTVDYAEGASLLRDFARTRVAVSLHDGSYSAGTDLGADRTDLALAARGEYALRGDRKRCAGFRALPDEGRAVLLGAAVDFEQGEDPDVLKVGLDATAAMPGTSLFAAVIRQYLTGSHGDAIAEQTGLVLQAATCLAPQDWEAFGRWEHLDFDGVYHRNKGAGVSGATAAVDDEALDIVTLGVNWYRDGQSSRWTLDLVRALDRIPVANTGSGLLAGSAAGQTVVRLQYQFKL